MTRTVSYSDSNSRSANASRKTLVLGCAATGAKFTPANHHKTGDDILDAICWGDGIPAEFELIEAEAAKLYQGGCRYFHIHARNPRTREQSCDNVIYAEYNRRLLSLWPDLILSYGASRNGAEIDDAIKRSGEWARISQAALPLENGGAHFVTLQAAVELQIVRDLEKQGFMRIDERLGVFETLRPLDDYTPSTDVAELSLPVYSTQGGKNYGRSSAQVQYAALQEAVRARCTLGLPQEVEWVQFGRSRAMTYVACNHMQPSLADTGRVNITVLFGFSPKLQFPMQYHEFRRVIDGVRSLADVADRPFRQSITVGAAVLPQHAARCTAPLDVGPRAGQVVSPLERLVAYASEPESDVDAVRFGMEDTPYLIDTNGALRTTNNVELMEVALDQLHHNDARLAIDPAEVRTSFLTGCDRDAGRTAHLTNAA